jgi:hypothetical protein
MASKKRTISSLIEQQLPGFISSEYENFSKFVGKYYEQLENQGQPLDIINNITKYRDIDYYEESLLKQYTELSSNVSSSQTTITVADATSFPEKNGYIRIGNEICFYQERTDTQFRFVSRGISGNTTLGDLYTKTEFVTSQAQSHFSGDQVYNVSNLFLYAFVKSFESQYLDSFPEKYLKGEVDKRTLIKNINKFYKSKGTDKSIKFIFNSIVSRDSNDIPEVFYPKESTVRPSTSDWITSYSLKVKVISGSVNNLIGQKIEQSIDLTRPEITYASAYIDNVIYRDSNLYEIVLDPASVNGTFSIISKTKLTTALSNSKTTGDRIDVGSTMGWKSSGSLLIGSEEIRFDDKNVNQFIIESRSTSPQNHSAGTEVYSLSTVTAGSTKFLVLGVLYNLNLETPAPYSEEGDKIQITKAGVDSSSPIIFDRRTSSTRWLINNTNQRPLVFQNSAVQTAINNLNANVSAVYEDDQYFYVCSSSYPSHRILNAAVTDLPKDQKVLRLIRKQPTTTTEIYETPARDIGVFVNGTPVYGCKDEEYVLYGKITSSEVTYPGFGYKNAPFVLINETAGKAKAIVSGEVLESIVIETEEIYNATPKVVITAGRNARARAVVTNGVITDIIVVNPGEYYSSPPIVRIIDLAGKGNFAEYTARVSENGQVIGFNQINQGRFYTQQNVQVELIEDAKGSEATAKVEIKRWYKNRFVKYQNRLDDSYGYIFSDFATKDKVEKTYGYGYVGNPRRLRIQLQDNLNSNFSEPTQKQHSPIIGFAYDGNPIYGPFGYSNPLDSTSQLTRLVSGYELSQSRVGGPSISQYPLGTFVDDYNWIARATTEKLYLDENNGRFCVTPDYPEGTYAYFITINQFNQPEFPYVIGKNYYSLPVDSNYNSIISQDDLPVDAKRLRSASIENNGTDVIAKINAITKGNISDVDIQNTSNNFQVGSVVRVDNRNTGGSGASALVSKVNGIPVNLIETVQTKALEINLSELAFLYAGDTITQQSTGAYGEIIGDVFNDTKLILRNVVGTFNTTNLISATIDVQSILVDKAASFTKDSIIIQTDNNNSVIARGVVAESINSQNVLKIKVTSGQFQVNDSYILKSSNLNDTFGVKIVTTKSLSKNISINTIDNKIAIVNTDGDHNLTVGDKIDISINPDDTQTQTTYYVRKRVYQRVKVNIPTFNSFINDSGIGTFEYLNGGDDYETGQYFNVELVFKDSTKIRPDVGAPGNPNNARATITVSNINGSGYGRVTNIVITNKGANYKKGDVLTVADSSLDRNNLSISTRRLIISVDHVGFSKLNTSVRLTSIVGLSINDELQIGSELVKVTNINTTTKVITLLRGQRSTNIVDHYNNQSVELYDPQYRFNFAFQILGQAFSDPYVFSYDKNTQILTLVYNYGLTTNINLVEKGNVFYDNSVPQKIVSLASVENPKPEFQFSKINADINFVSNPIIDITKFYKYKFDTSHFSMAGTYLDFSPSSSFNIIPIEVQSTSEEPGQPNSAVFVKFGYNNTSYTSRDITVDPIVDDYIVEGDLIIDDDFFLTQNILVDKNNKSNSTNFLKYYYFDKSSSLGGEGGYLKIKDDPLQGEKVVYYTTNNKFVYKLNELSDYDGLGNISYSTNSKFAVGSISKISIENSGEDYVRVPIISGVDIAIQNEALVKTTYNNITKSIDYVEVIDGGISYSKPKAVVVDGDGYGAEFSVFSRDGKVLQVNVIDGGKSYSYPPTVKIIESDVKMYFISKNIGIPNGVEIIQNGYDHHLDKTLYSSYTSHLVLLLKNHEDDAFSVGEKIVQTTTVNGQTVETAFGFVSKNGWRPGSNILRLENITGSFDPFIEIKGDVKKKTATIVSLLNSEFDNDIRGYFDNLGKFVSDKGHVSSFSQRLTDSFYYQDYSYVIKSKTPTNVWRDLIKQTTHPAGFELFGEVLVESNGITTMPAQDSNKVEQIRIINLSPQLVELKEVKRNITQSILKYNDINVEKGVGSVALNIDSNSETIARELILSAAFNGDFDSYNGQLIGTKTFTLLEKQSNLPYAPYNNQQLIITLDGVLQEPGEAYTVSGNQITFATPPYGERITEGQTVPGQRFYCRSIKFKNDQLNQRYLRKLKSLSSEFDGITKVFDLYYDNGDIVKTDIYENLIVTLNGVLQNSREFQNNPVGNSYHIIRNPNPLITDRIEFSQAPINHEDQYQNINTELAGAEKCFIYGFGNYKRLTIDQKQISAKPNGPFLLYNEVSKTIAKVEDTRYALVFIDGVLQIDDESYEIIGSTLTFRKPLNYYISESGETVYPNISVILFYGRDIFQGLTMFDFEPDVYYNIIKFNLQGQNVFNTIKAFEILPNKMLSTQRITLYQDTYLLGELKEIKAFSTDEVELTVINTRNLIDEDFTDENLTLLINGEDVKEITGNYNITYTYAQNEDGNRLLKSRSNAPIWLYNTKLGLDLEENKRYKRISNIVPGDLIKVEGENEYRQVFVIPNEVKTRNFNDGEIASQEVYATISCSNYNGITRGEGLSIGAEIFGGEVASLKWNKRELELFLNNNILVQPTAYQYYTNPVINFIPVDGNGGGAKAEVIVCNGQVLDVVLLNGGYGYTSEPKVVVARRFSIVKKNPRKIQSNIALLQLIPKLKLDFSIISEIEIVQDDDNVIYIFNVLMLGQDFNLDLDIIRHIWPNVRLSGINGFDKTQITYVIGSLGSIESVTSTYTNIINRLEIPIDGIAIGQIDKTLTKTAFIGTVDKVLDGNYIPGYYSQDILGNSLGMYESAKFGSTGYSDVSKVTIQEFSMMYPDSIIQDFDIPGTTKITSNPKNTFNLGYHSVQEFGAYLDIEIDLNDEVVYIANTSRFPSQGKILVGKEIISYTQKLNDRFLFVTRGVDGTKPEAHPAGQYIRTVPQ